MRHILSAMECFGILLSSFSCEHAPTTTSGAGIQIIAEDVGATAAWVRFKLANGGDGGPCILNRDGTTIFATNAGTLDTVLLQDSLLPNHTYRFLASRRDIWGTEETSSLELTSLDTTSEDYVWQTYAFGGGDDSGLSDVYVSDQNDIWAVGEISVRDTSGNVINPPFNLARWDGQEWNLQSLMFQWNSIRGYASAEAVFGFASDDILVSSGGSVMHWSGAAWNSLGSLLQGDSLIGSIFSMWGTSVSDLYGVGLLGSIVRWSGTSWLRMESGTTTRITDVWGIAPPGDQEEVFCAVSDLFVPGDRKILKLTEAGSIDTVAWNSSIDVLSVWTHNQYSLYACGTGVFENKRGYWSEIDLGMKVYASSMRGTALNDIFVVGASGLIAHYNGSRWTVLRSGQNVNYSAVGVRGDIFVAVGIENGKAFITVGKRN